MQDARKSDGLDVSDRISAALEPADTEVAGAIAEHQAMIGREVLAVDFDSQLPGALADTGAAAEVTGAEVTGAEVAGAELAGAEVAGPDGLPGPPDELTTPDEAGKSPATYRHENAELGLTFWIQRR